MAPEYYFERCIKYSVGNLIPKAQQDLDGKAKSFLMELSGVRYADYTSQPKRGGLYEPSCVRGYLPSGQQIREEPQAE